MEQRIVNVPLVGGINEEDDTFSATPPEMKSLVNVSAVKKGALDRRLGWQLVSENVEGRGASITPARSFVGTVESAIPASVEAISSCDTPTGKRAVLAAGNKFFEYVGADGDHGFREVNDLPRYCGTLTTVASTGGAVIEIESALFGIEETTGRQDVKRITVWTTGLRSGSELTSDITSQSQDPGDGNSLYYSIQWVDNESFIVPPTRLKNVAGNYVTSAQDLRLVMLQNSFNVPTSDVGTWPFVTWFDKNTGQIVGAVINPLTGAQSPAASFPRTIATLAACHRRFDVAALTGPTYTLGVDLSFVYAMCSADIGSNVSGSALEVRVASVDITTGAITSLASIANAMGMAATPWTPWAQRGVMLEQSPELAITGPGWTARVSIAARVIARETQLGPVYTNRFDGQLAMSLLSVSYAGGVYSFTRNGWNYIPCIGFQTNDNLENLYTASAGSQHYSGSPLVSSYYASNLPTTLALPEPGPYNLNGTTSRTSEIAITLPLTGPAGTSQTYFCGLDAQSAAYVLRPYSSVPYRYAASGGTDTREFSFAAVRSMYPRVLHTYPNDNPIPFGPSTLQARQTNMIVMPPSGATNTGWTPGTYANVPIVSAGQEICQATIHVAADGSVDAIAIEDCATGPLPGFNYAGPLPMTTAVSLAAVGPWNAATTGVLAATGFNFAQPAIIGGQLTGSDTPDRVVGQTPNLFYKGGQEHCVHRWSVARYWGAAPKAIVALSSASAIRQTNPNGDEPFGAASPMAYNNFFEVYQYTAPALQTAYTALVPSGGGQSGNLICALGGPWRIVGGLVLDDSELCLSVCPGGDDAQASTFLLRLPKGTQGVITVPNGDPPAEPIGQYPSPDKVTYSFPAGVFIESANMMRTTAVPLNVPSLRRTVRGLTVGALRESSSNGQQSCMAIDYETVSQNWRTMQRMAEYTFVNGGILSVFDGSNCNEHGLLVWPQRDLTSISFGDGGAQVAQVASGLPAFLPVNAANFVGDPLGTPYPFFPVQQITRPYFFNEAGMKLVTGNLSLEYGDATYGTGYGRVTTSWGGDPSKSYESVYQELRTQQFSSFTKTGMTGGSSQRGPHYYGRYQSTPTDFSETTTIPSIATKPAVVPWSFPFTGKTGGFVWAPRSARGYDMRAKQNGGKENMYSQDETGGNFLMSFCYEYMDATGRTVRSAPSAPIQWTVCAELYCEGIDREAQRSGATATIFKWGFFAPRLELTNRSKSAAADPRRVTLQPYSTCEPYSTVMYRMPWSNFLNPISDFVVTRNTSRAVVPNACAPFDGSGSTNVTPCGFVVTNTNTNGRGCFDGPTGDFNGMLREPYLYTTGSVLDNVAPPSCKAMCVHQNRLVIGGADDPTVVWFSKELSPTDAPGFNDLLTIRIEAGGAVTGLASMNSSLFIFKESDVYVVSGSMPDDTGNGNTLAEPVRLPSGIGCIDPRSVIATPIGIFFQSKRSIELLTPDLRITPIGDKIIDQRATFPYVTSVSHNATTQEVYFVLHDNRITRTDTIVGTRIFVYSYMINAWYEWRNDQLQLGRGMAAMTVIGDKPWMAMRNPVGWASQAFVYQQWNGYVDKCANPNLAQDTYVLSYYTRQFRTAPFALNQVQGFQRVKRIRLLGTPVDGRFLKATYGMVLHTDEATPQTSSWTAAQVDSVVGAQGLLQLETHVAKQKGQLLALEVIETAPATVSATVENFRLANIALVVGLKQGLNKRITEDAKH